MNIYYTISYSHPIFFSKLVITCKNSIMFLIKGLKKFKPSFEPQPMLNKFVFKWILGNFKSFKLTFFSQKKRKKMGKIWPPSMEIYFTPYLTYTLLLFPVAWFFELWNRNIEWSLIHVIDVVKGVFDYRTGLTTSLIGMSLNMEE